MGGDWEVAVDVNMCVTERWSWNRCVTLNATATATAAATTTTTILLLLLLLLLLLIIPPPQILRYLN